MRRHRNFYGVYKVYDKDGLRYLQHGTTQHGRQYLAGPRRDTPLAYFHPTTPAAGVLTAREFSFGTLGMIGLGSGALATYAREGQSFTIYELDPDNLPIAEDNFSYLKLARERGAALSFVFGDGRVKLRDGAVGSLDLLIIDAFNSGSIPVHLLTVEAIEAYFKVLAPDGLLLLHLSNKVLDLDPVVYGNADHMGLAAVEQSNEGHIDPDAELTDWMALTRSEAVMAVLRHRLGWHRRKEPAGGWPAPWTDRYCNVLGAMW